MTPYINTEAVQQALNEAAIALRVRYAQEMGETYCVEELQQALIHWLELSIEALAEDALFHTVEGDRAYAFNRRAFEQQVQRLQPTSPLPAELRRASLAA
ncbi:hypothetical protein IFO70_15135 [Phormidium tenue FACHB-886]|nr:hypothetical protein [Phormidium tenue FACHB-886]